MLQHNRVIAAVVASATFIVAAVALLFALRFSVRHHVLHLIDPQRLDLPQPTLWLGPLLGDAFAPGPLGWLGAVLWWVAIAAPVVLAIWSLRAASPSDVISRWILGLSVHIPAVAVLTAATALGLWLPFQFI